MGGTSVVAQFNASILLALLVVQTVIVVEGLGAFDPITKICSQIECASYEVIDTRDGYEVRRYNSSVWISTNSFMDINLLSATVRGLSKINGYLDGENESNTKIKQALPILTGFVPRFRPQFYTVNRYLPAENHVDPPPPPKGLNVNKWRSQTFAVVKQVQGPVTDSFVADELDSLTKSLEGSVWEEAIKNTLDPSINRKLLRILLYKPPVPLQIETYEIMITFELKDEESVQTF